MYRKIAAELSLPKRRREKVVDFSTACRTEYDRLVSNSLDVPQACIKNFKKRFAANSQHQPEVVSGGIETIRARRPSASETLEQVVVSSEDDAAAGGGVRTAVGEPNRARRFRRASTVINDALISPGTQITPFRSTRLPDNPSQPTDLPPVPPGDTEESAPLGMVRG